MKTRFLSLLLCLALAATCFSLAAADPAEVKWSGDVSVAQYALGPIEDDQITPLVEEILRDQYGYDVKFDIVYLENNEYDTLLNLRISGGETPDVFRISSATQLDTLYKQGVIKGWSEEFFRENAPETAAFIDAGNPLGTNANIVKATWNMSMREGEMCCIPLISINNGALINVIYNTQWLDALGAEVPESLDDFVDLMYRFTNEDPDGNGEKDTYGMSSSMLNVIFGAYGGWVGFMGFDTGFWYENEEGGLISCDVLPGNKDALALIRQLYVDGVLDPEFVTGENQGGYWAISHSFVNGRIGVSHAARMTHYTPADLYGTGNSAGTVLQEFQAIQGPDATVTIGPWPEGPDGYAGGFLRYTNTVLGGQCYDVDMSDEKLAALFQIMNVFSNDADLCKLAVWGVEGVHYETQDNEFHSRVSLLEEGVNGYALGLGRLRGIYGAELPLNEEYMEANYSATQKWMFETMAQYKNLSVTTGYVNKLWTSLPSESLYSGELNTYRDETWLKIIAGDLDVDYYDTYVDEWMARGGAVLTEEANEWYAINK